MEKKIKTLYILSIAAILAFLGMQSYWLYSRYEYSLREYEQRAQDIIENTIDEYNRLRLQRPVNMMRTLRTSNNLNMYVDSAGVQRRTATVTTILFDASKFFDIDDMQELTPDEEKRLVRLLADSIEAMESKKASFDVTDAPSDGMAWNAMRNFEKEMQSPFSAESLDSLLCRENIDAKVTLAVTDSILWNTAISPHCSAIDPHFTMTVPYSELERKCVVIDCRIPASEVIHEMAWTLAIAGILSLLLISCLVWQFNTIVKLTRLDKMRNSFITTMIHELKRPISTLKMCVSGIDNDKLMADSRMRHEWTAETRIALDNLSAYFSKLRDITFNNVEQIPLNVSSFHLAEMIDGILKSIAIPDTKRVNIENCVHEGLLLSGDRSHLSNVIVNLIENAVKYSGENVAVKISAESTADGITINISDNGFGISAADQKRIFCRFYRGKAYATDIPGMGLGLAYLKLLVEAHGGEISVESTEGTGSTFTIILPQ